MAGATTQSKIESRTQRRKLKPGRQAHFRTLVPGRSHVGYQRNEGAAEGRWFLRRYNGSAYSIEPLGLADDVKEADGERVLNFEQAHRKALTAVDAAEGKPKGRLTVRKALANYIDFLEAQGRPTEDTQRRAVAHILPKLGDVELVSLTSDKIRKWLAALASAPAFVRTKKGERQNYKEATDDAETIRRRRSSANRVLTILKAALNHAYDEKHVVSNDAWGRRVKPFRDVDVARVRYLSIAEAKRLINACAPDFRPLVISALETGCRYGELTRLEVEDFNPDAGTVNIRKSKSGKVRHVVLTDQGVAFFRQACAGRARSQLMFRRADGEPWKASHQNRPMREACARAKITPPVGIHGLRHTWASHAVMNGVPLLVVAKNLGHANTVMVEKHYGHLAQTYIVDAIRTGAPKFGFKPDKKIATLR
ncbi:MAG: integrase family protein [Hyphomicrobiales bacterium]|nr:integrase family protein [Hyphomicrobiales bacterium]